MRHNADIFKVSDEVAHRRIDGQVYAIVSRSRMLYALNETASYIWDMLIMRTRPSDIARSLARDYFVSCEDAMRDVGDTISYWREEGLIEPACAVKSPKKKEDMDAPDSHGRFSRKDA